MDRMILLLMLIPSLLFAVNLPSQGTPSKYTKNGNYLTLDKSLNPKLKHRVEVGDRNTPSEFAPQINFVAWDECEFAIKIPMLPGAQCEWEGETLLYGNNNVEARFYEKEHGYEYEVTFLRRPQNNSWAFDVISTDVKLIYQRPLTPEELALTNDDGDPIWGYGREDAPGSYLVMKNSAFRNYTGGTEYGLGIVGQIWRPKITDANSQSAWCDLFYDSATKKLTVTIPQSFFDSATLPWVLDPELGYNPGVSEGTAPTYTQSIENYLHGESSTTVESGTVDEIHSYTNASNSGRVCKMNLYEHNSGNAVANAASSEFTPSELSVWRYRNYSYTGTKPTISASTEYIPVVWASQGSGTHIVGQYDGDGNHYYNYTYGASWPSSVSWSSTTKLVCVWIVYTAGSGGGGATGGGKTNSTILILE